MYNSVKGASLQGGIISKENKNNLKDQELKKLLIDMSLIDGENEFTKIMKYKKGLALPSCFLTIFLLFLNCEIFI